METTSSADGSTLLSIPEKEFRDCPDTPEHRAVCLNFATRRMMQLGFQLPESLRISQKVACKAVMLTCETDVLFMFKCLLDDCERLRDEREGLRTADRVQRHELGLLTRRSSSLERQLVMKEKKLADAEYRLEEQRQLGEELRAEAKREAQKARLAQSGMQRLQDQVRHRQHRTEQELFEARLRLERSGDRVGPPRRVGLRRAAPARRGGAPGTVATARHAAVVAASDLFEAVELLPLTRAPTAAPAVGRGGGGGPRRNRSLPSAAARGGGPVWYKVPAAVTSAADVTMSNSGGSAGGGRERLGDQSVISLAETIDASGCRAATANTGSTVASVSPSSDWTASGAAGRSRKD